MRNLSWQVGAIAVFLLLWQGLAALSVWPPRLLPSPAEVAVALARMSASRELAMALWTTGWRIALGFGVAALLGIGLGMLLAQSARLSALAGPVFRGLQAMPSICWFPLAILWMGLNEGAILFVTVIGALCAVAAGTEVSIRTIPPAYLRAAATMGARGGRLCSAVVLPAALPTLLTALRAGWSFAWRSLLAAEMLSPSVGLGQVLNRGAELADAAQVMAIMAVVLLVGVLVERLVFARSERALRRRWGLERAA